MLPILAAAVNASSQAGGRARPAIPPAFVLVNQLDQAVQERYKTDTGIPDHRAVFSASGLTVGQKLLIDKANSMNIAYETGLIVLPHASGLKTGITVPASNVIKPVGDPFRQNASAALDQKITAAMPVLKGVITGVSSGTMVNVENGRTLYAIRPVRAAVPGCLNCHKGARLGATLGAVLYAVDMPAAVHH
jgi:hypothetical protein